MTVNSSFLPNRQIVTNITRANPGIVTTSQAHGYSTGLFVRLFFPQNFGMQQVAEEVYEITVQSSTEFSLNIDTSNFDVFDDSGASQSPQVIPVGSDALSVLEPVKNNGNIIPEQ